MKKKAGLGLSALLSASLFLAACGNDTNENVGDDNATEGDTGGAEKITIFQSKVEISEALERMAEEYEEETGVEVEIWGTTGDDYFQQLQIRMNSDQGPSIFTIGHASEARLMDSYIYDMSDESYVDNIAENMAMEIDGKLVGVPYGVEGFGFVYNKDLIDPEDVANYESFVNMLAQFQEEDVEGLSLSQEGYFLIGHMSNYPFSLQEDNIAFMEQVTNGEVDFTDVEEFEAFGQMLEDIRENTVNPLEKNYDSQIGDFATGRTAMIHQGNWAYGMFADYDLDFEIGMLPVPLMDNDKLAVGVGQNWAVNANKGDDEIQAALDFLDWMHTSETGHRYIVEEFDAIPAYTNIEAPGLDTLSQDVLEYTNAGQTIPWSQGHYPANLVVNDWVPAAQNFFIDDSVTGQDVINEMYESWKKTVE
ncbi:ABC transporter substrate-binding protein [Bacillus shivajii]|uniref:sugar ABC transporter substrate-binding protein n=1 Tax=Bacillus shivajii TaxID=1983719 RepID=UPI001CFAAB71|nr:ABC transporter substrate-binding protein [Bacillus shivajii]UCZ52486.1 ABC transporter substrate-binding protein [Bacillus shivajii]